jgi:predicted secreted Zn-dependent protease
MKPIIAALGFAMMAAPLAPGLASGSEVTPRISYVYYSVPYAQGLSVTELILQHSPLGGSGRRFSGYTRYNMKYEVDYSQPTIDVCRVNSPQVFCDCEITLPRLEGGESDPETRRLFAAELSRINRHEQTHCDIAVRHAQTLLAAIRKLKDMPCQEADEVVARRFQEIAEACQTDQTRFDHSEYGYKNHLLRTDQRMMDAGFKAAPQVKNDSRPGPDQGGRTGNLRSVNPPSDQEFMRKGIFKDENGVWRNY